VKRAELVETKHPELSIRRQCELLHVRRSVFYYKPKEQSESERRIMRVLDEIYMIDPCMVVILKFRGVQAVCETNNEFGNSPALGQEASHLVLDGLKAVGFVEKCHFFRLVRLIRRSVSWI
jgi:hypothetical protein